MAVEQLEGGLDNMGSQMKGFIKVMKEGRDSRGFGFITAEDGKDYFFSPFSLASFDPEDKSPRQLFALNEEFSKLPEGAKVIFTIKDTPKGPEVRNLVLDTSGEVSTLVPATEGAVA